MKAAIGIDIGTTSIAAVVTDGEGQVLTTKTVPNPSAGEPTPDGRDEQDPDAILATVRSLLDDCTAFIRSTAPEARISLGWTGQMHGLVAVDRSFMPLTPFVTWRDRRAAPPKLGSGIMADWQARQVAGIHRALTIPGYVIARLAGRCVVDVTFLASMGTDEQLAPFSEWLPDRDDASMLGDNQAGVFAAQHVHPNAVVINVGTSGQLSRLVPHASCLERNSTEMHKAQSTDCASNSRRPTHEALVSLRPYPGGRTLLCRASHVGGAPLAKLREELGYSWERLNDEAETNPRVAACLADIVDDLAKGIDLTGVETVVGVGNAVRLNPCLRRAIEQRLHVACIVPEVAEMAAWGAALFAGVKSF